MANVKITELTNLTDPSTTDVMPVVDVDADVTKKVSVGEVVGKITGDVDVATDGTSSIAAGVIVDADVNASAEIAVSKLADGTARQLLQTDAAGTGVEWTSNVDVPGTLDVTGAATFDSTVSAAGLASLDGGIDVDGAFTVANTSGNVSTSGTLGVTGQSTLASAAISDLTEDRVVIAGASGELEDSANLTFDGSELGITGTLDVSSNGTIGGDLTVVGDLTVEGTTTTLETQTVTVEDKNIELGVVDTPSDTTADGGGITLKGATDKTINWVNATDAWTSSEHIELASGKEFYIDGNGVLNATTLGSGVVNSSLTSVGTLTSGELGAGFTTVATAQGGTGQTTYANGQLLIGKTDGTLAKATLTAGSGIDVTNGDGSITVDVDLKADGGLVIESTELALDLGASSITGTLGVADGGTGQTTYTDGELLIGTSAGSLAKATLTAGSGIDVTNGDGSITVAIDSSVVTTTDTGTVTSTMIEDGTIVNSDINASAAIADTKLDTISTAGKVSNSATTATDVNTASAIVARDASGNFTAGTITADLTGNADTATALETARDIGGVSFDGTANINLPGVNTAGDQDTSGNAATATKLDSSRTFAVTGDVTGTVNSDLTSGVNIATSIASEAIVDADINASAAIAGTKIDPDFGSQDTTTTGTSTAASFIPTSSTVPTNGVYLPAANQLGLATDGTQRLLIEADGDINIDSGGVFYDATNNRLAIGTTNPGVALHVDGDIRCDGVYGETDNNTSIQFPGSDVITFNEGGSEAARIHSSGRLLVGTSTSAGNARFEVAETRRLSATPGGSGWLELTDSASVTSGTLTDIATVSLDFRGSAYFRLEVCAGHTDADGGYSSAASIREGLIGNYGGSPRILNNTETRNLTGSVNAGVIATAVTTDVVVGTSGTTSTFIFRATATMSGSASGGTAPQVSYRLSLLSLSAKSLTAVSNI